MNERKTSKKTTEKKEKVEVKKEEKKKITAKKSTKKEENKNTTKKVEKKSSVKKTTPKKKIVRKEYSVDLVDSIDLVLMPQDLLEMSRISYIVEEVDNQSKNTGSKYKIEDEKDKEIMQDIIGTCRFLKIQKDELFLSGKLTAMIISQLVNSPETSKADNRSLKLLVANEYVKRSLVNSEKAEIFNKDGRPALVDKQAEKLLDIINEIDRFEEIKLENDKVVNASAESDKLRITIDVSKKGDLSKEEFSRAKDIAYTYREIADVKVGLFTKIAWALRDWGMIKPDADRLLLTDGREYNYQEETTYQSIENTSEKIDSNEKVQVQVMSNVDEVVDE